MNISTYFERAVRAGEAGYYSERERGTIDVWHDSQRWVYRRPVGASVREVRAAILAAFEQDSGSPMRISGRFPSYTVESL